MTSVTIPTTLPVLPTNNNRVLLPGIVVRYLVERSESVALFDSLVTQSSTVNALVAVIPCVVKGQVHSSSQDEK
jgi:hypothetical protein